MPFERKKKGGARGGGRPGGKGVGAQGKEASEEYFREAMAKSRSQVTVPQARYYSTFPFPLFLHFSFRGPGRGVEREGRSRGRPSLSPSGAMTEEELVERRKAWMKRERLGEKRRRAVSCRRDRQPAAKRRSRSLGGRKVNGDVVHADQGCHGIVLWP